MKQAIFDDIEVQAIAERLGAWPAIQGSIAQGLSGALGAGGWVFGFYQDGVVAIEASDPVEATMLLAMMAGQTGGPITMSLREPAPATAH